MRFHDVAQHFFRQSAGLLPENENVVRAESRCVMALLASGGQGEEASAIEFGFARRPVRVANDPNEFVVIEAGAFEFAVFPGKSERFDET